MRGEKLRVWFAPEDMQGGQKLIEQIDRAIQVNDRLLLVLSEHSMSSDWVRREIKRVRATERDFALGAGLLTPPLGATAGLPELLETCGHRSAGSGDPRTARRKLFPIRLVTIDRIRDWRCDDADTGEDLAEKIREYHIPDFSNWKDHDAFESAFADLLRDLRAGGSLNTNKKHYADQRTRSTSTPPCRKRSPRRSSIARAGNRTSRSCMASGWSKNSTRPNASRRN